MSHLTPKQTSDIRDLRTYYAADRRAFFCDCLRIPDRDSPAGKLIPFELNPAQEALLRLVENIERFNVERTSALNRMDDSVRISHLPVDILIVKPRKEGISTFINGLSTHFCEFNSHATALLIAHRLDGAQHISRIAQRFIHQWPQEQGWKIRMARPPSDAGLVWDDKWGSRIRIMTCKDEGVARGGDCHFLHLSEVAHFATSDAVSAAKSSMVDDHYAFEESTANGLDPYFYDAYQKALTFEQVYAHWRKHGRTPETWNGRYKFFWAWWQDPHYTLPLSDEEATWLEEHLDDEEIELREAYELTLGQLKWRRQTIATKCADQSRMSPEDFFRQEYPSNEREAFVSTGRDVFGKTRLEEQRKNLEDGLGRSLVKPHWYGEITVLEDKTVAPYNATVKSHIHSGLVLYDKPRPDACYVLGADVAQGEEETPEGDDSVVLIFDRTDGTQLIEAARFTGKPDTRDYADIIYYLHRLYNNAYLMVEANYPGNATCQRLVELHAAPMYHRKVEEKVGEEQTGERFVPGWKTFENTKGLLVGHLQSAISRRQIHFRSIEAVRQCEIFTQINKRYTHPPGDKDDYVIAAGLANYAHWVTAPPVAFVSRYQAERKISQQEAMETGLQRAIRNKIEKSRRQNEIEKARRDRMKGLPRPWDLLR